MTKFSDAMAFLKALGLSDEMSSFSGRKRIQKTIYLLRQFGADLKFGYSWYLHGPYSPELTRTLFNPSAEDIRVERELTRKELDIANRVRNFLADDFYSVDSIELVVSLVYLIKHGPDQGLSNKRAIVQHLSQQKPQFGTNEIEEAWKKIENSGMWSAALAEIER